jgi:hypothetical protein
MLDREARAAAKRRGPHVVNRRTKWKEIAMKHGKSLTLGALVATGFLGAAPAISATMNNTMTRLPPEMTQGGITYMSGGIGHDEAAAMRKEEREFPLSLEFVKRAKPADKYLAGVDVTIKGPDGKTELHALADGPMLLARLPDGKYKVSAELNGTTRTRNVVIAQHKPEHVVFEW